MTHCASFTPMQVQLESQQAQAQELQSALERERELSAQLRQRAAAAATSPAHSGANTPAGPSPAGLSQAEEGCSQVRTTGAFC